MTAATAPDFPPFAPRPPWFGGDLQTLRNALVVRHVDLDAAAERRLFVDLADGDRLQAVLNLPRAEAPGRPLLALLHGLAGSEDSVYMRASARHFLSLGWRVARLDMRGAGPSRATCRGHYHAGLSEDLRRLLAGLGDALTGAGVVMMGYSLGANQMLKMLGEDGASAAPVVAAVSVSAPLDLGAASRRFLKPRNCIYQRWLLAEMKRQALAPAAALDAGERRAIEEARTVRDFDDRFIAPRHGFSGADDYYARASSGPYLDRIRVPTLLVQAADDPWIPAETFRRRDWSANPHLTPLLARSGGHVGFHGRGSRVPWHDRCAEVFLAGR